MQTKPIKYKSRYTLDQKVKGWILQSSIVVLKKVDTK